MQIANIFVFLWCLVLTECRDENQWLADNVDTDMNIDVLRELKRLREQQDKLMQIIEDNREQQDKQDIQIQENREKQEKQGEMIEDNRNLLSSFAAKRSQQDMNISYLPKSRFTAQGCISETETIQLWCPGERTISVTKAYYGHFKFPCNWICCPPTPYQDCTELVTEAEPNDWKYLKSTCNDKKDCNWKYSGRLIECEAFRGQLAAYMQIYYDCLPGDVNGPVGFTAEYVDDLNKEYEESQLIPFSGIQSNFGFHYYHLTSSFLCPFHGIYLFSLSYHSSGGTSLYLAIARDNVVIMEMMATDDEYSQSGSLVIKECDVEQVVYVRSEGGILWGDRALFSGYLLHRYV